MPLNERNTKTFYRTQYPGQLQKITLLKRNDDMDAHTVTAYTLFNCRISKISKTGEPIQGDMLSDHRTVWHIPKSELSRNGIDHINMLDRIVDKQNRYWQPESNTIIIQQLFENMVMVNCLRVDPPPLDNG